MGPGRSTRAVDNGAEPGPADDLAPAPACAAADGGGRGAAPASDLRERAGSAGRRARGAACPQRPPAAGIEPCRQRDARAGSVTDCGAGPTADGCARAAADDTATDGPDLQRVAMLSVPAPSWAHRRWRAMGSTAELVVCAADCEELADQAVARIVELEACWSRFQPASELSVLNRCSGHWCPVSPLLWQAIETARAAWLLTGGRFDPTVLGRLRALGYDRTFSQVAPDGPAVAPPPADRRASFADVELDAAGQSVRLPAGLELDLGGIGKGLAADLVADELAGDATSVSLSLGGDVAVRGPGPGSDAAWPIPVAAPNGARLGEFPLVDEAIVQSTTELRRWRRGRRTMHHLVDPATGWPADTGVIAAVVTGPQAAFAEALAKAAIIAGARDGLALLEQSGVDGWLFLGHGERVSTVAVSADLVMADAG